MVKFAKFSEAEIQARYERFDQKWDVKNLGDLRERQPEIVEDIRGLLEAGQTPGNIGHHMRHKNPQMWVESKYAESVARALLAEIENFG